LPVLEFLEEQADTIKGIVEAGDRRNPTRTLREESGEDSEVFEAEELKRTDAGEKFLEALKAKFAESVTDGAGGPDKEIWATVVDKWVWTLLDVSLKTVDLSSLLFTASRHLVPSEADPISLSITSVATIGLPG
jgi:hypothetical protein